MVLFLVHCQSSVNISVRVFLVILGTKFLMTSDHFDKFKIIDNKENKTHSCLGHNFEMENQWKLLFDSKIAYDSRMCPDLDL